MPRHLLSLLMISALLVGEDFAEAQQKLANYDESKIPPYTLPALLKTQAGKAVTTADEWTHMRRPEVLALFEQHVFGKTPSAATWGKVDFQVTEVKKDALGGKATRKLIHLSLPEHPAWAGMDVMLYTPNGLGKPAPCFVGPSFNGNHAVSPETDIPLSTRWMRASKDKNIVNNRATEASRGSESSTSPISTMDMA